MWCYNILGDNKGSISHISQLVSINTGSILLTDYLDALRRGNSDPTLAFKRIEWRKFIDYFGIGIEADPPRVGKKNVHFVHIGYIPIPSSIKLRISRHHLDKEFNF